MMSFFARNKYLLAGLVALSQTAVLGYMIESRASILRNGNDVVLLTEPVDPRDLLRGDYVTLGYPISRIDTALIKGIKPDAQGSHKVYVALQKSDGSLWMVTRASWQPIADKTPEETILVGKTPDYFSIDENSNIAVTYGIEKYYVPEGEGKKIEDGQRQKAVQVTVAVDKNGRAQIKSLSLDGATLYSEPLY
jgi:uncharacterized membrane-anchored protein